MSSRPHPALAVVLAILAVMAPVAAGPALASDSGGEESVTLSADIPINSDASVQEYEQNGVVSGGVGAPQMEITIGEERDDVGLGYSLDPLDGSTRNDFIRIEHKEGMERTVRVPVRSDYWKPFPREGLESVDESHTADLKPVQMDGGKFSLITVTFDGKDSAVFPIPEDAVAVYRVSERTEENVNSTFGVDLGLTPTPWSQVDSSVFGNDTAVRMEGEPDDMMIQYNDGSSESAEWLKVPDEPTDGVPVYRMEKEGVSGAVYVVSRTTDPPQIRYKTKSTWGDEVSLMWREAKSVPDRIAGGFGWELPDISLGFGMAVPPSTGVFA